MSIVTDPTKAGEQSYHTLYLADTEDGEYHVMAKNNERVFAVTVGSVALAGESAGMMKGAVHLDAAEERFHLEYVDFTDEYGYDEIQVNFGESEDRRRQS